MQARVTMTDVGPGFGEWVSAVQQRTESALDRFLPPNTIAPARLHEAMRYAALGGGKRVRPLLCHAAGALSGAAPGALDAAACALELIHVYSLVHDDMPCMDDDVLRRGKPTVHVQFGEATALLAGDALQALAFELLTPEGDAVPPAMQADLCRLLACAAGAHGMAGGQAIDLASVGKPLAEPELRAMHRLKTGALLQGSVRMGAACASDVPTAARKALDNYGAAIGLAFQVVDDILDVTADSAALGKTAGKDAAADKPTYVSLLGLAASQALADELRAQAHGALDASGLRDVSRLRALADLVVNRKN